MLNSVMTKTSSECMDNLSAHELTPEIVAAFLRGHIRKMLEKAYQKDWILEYRYERIALDLLDIHDDELGTMIHEIEFGIWEKKRSVLLERMYKGLDMIKVETDGKKKKKYEQHYEKLKQECKEVEDRCLVTRY